MFAQAEHIIVPTDVHTRPAHSIFSPLPTTYPADAVETTNVLQGSRDEGVDSVNVTRVQKKRRVLQDGWNLTKESSRVLHPNYRPNRIDFVHIVQIHVD